MGLLFFLSALDPFVRIPEEVANLVIVAAIYVISLSLFEIALFLLYDGDPDRMILPARRAGRFWSVLIFALPFLDYLLGWGPVTNSVEDGAALGPLHAVAAISIYILPVIATMAAIHLGRHSGKIIAGSGTGMRILLRGLGALVLSLLGVLAGAAANSNALYRAGHIALEGCMLAWVLFMSARPDLFRLAKQEICVERAKNRVLEFDEALEIGARIEKLTADPGLLRDAELSLASLAVLVKVPAYRLSIFFNSSLHSSFPVWLNARRIEFARELLLARRDMSILDIALDVGYSSKSSFNSQFSRIVGMSPSEWRKAQEAKRLSGPPDGASLEE
ncbi:MAG TPA: AraC family transcriptional regulator [Rectinemataceae bacterium]|nr:AraC family transcriptional regulator [Rectinemataceae bacterium]